MAKVNKEKFEDIPVCMYAGDQEDEFCASCNGKTMTVDGVEYSCKECQAYTPKKEEPVEQPVAPQEQPREDIPQPEVGDYTPVGITTTIKAESGLSIETKKGWYRFSYTEERIIPESADIEQEKAALWDSVNAEVDRQAEEIKLLVSGS